jgi:hypothetical protein
MIKKILFIFLIFSTIKMAAQRTNSSPYSFFGIGEQYSSQTVEQASMGGIGVAYSNRFYLNFRNPAANADMGTAIYSFGLLNNDLTIKDNTGSQSSTSSNLRYISLGFPIGKHAGFSFGFQPVSAVGYSLTNQLLDASGDISELTLFSGSGGVNRLYGAVGVQVLENLSVGLEASYSFGKTENNILNQRANVQLGTKHSQNSIIRGNSFKLGTQYKKTLKNNLRLDLGATVNFANSLSAEGEETLYSLSVGSTGTEIPRDVIYSQSAIGSFDSPVITNMGAGVGKTDKWYAGAEYEFRGAVETNGYLEGSDESFAFGSANRFSLGGFYIPKINSISSYFERITYRAGVRFENTGLLVNGTPNSSNFTKVNDFGISFGLGLPLGNRISNLNLGFEYGKKGTTNNNLIEENYFNIRASLSLNAIGNLAWFQKRKID